MIVFENYSFYYSKNKLLFENLNFQLPKGKIYGLFGENGSGKTTLLNSLTGLIFPKTGEILINGEAPKDRRPVFLQSLYYVADTITLPKISTSNFVKIYSLYYPNFSDTDFKQYLKDFNIENEAKPYKSSFGQQKKFILAFALACNTPLLIMDEPTNGLDIPSKNQFRKIIASKMDSEKTIVISTHQAKDLEQLIDHVLILNNNQLVVNEDAYEITKKLAFNFYSSKPIDTSNCITMDETIGGYKVIEKNTTGEETNIDIEQLVSASFSNPEALYQHLNFKKQTDEQYI